MEFEYLDHADLQASSDRMRDFSLQPPEAAPERVWLCQHQAAYSVGAAAPRGLPRAIDGVPVLRLRRSGPPLWHGPGQLAAYPLLDLRRRRWGPREYVYRLEEAVLRTLGVMGVTGHRVQGAPGVYLRTDDPFSHDLLPQRPMRRRPGSPRPVPDFRGIARIAAIGLRLYRQRVWHGLWLNVATDPAPAQRLHRLLDWTAPVVDLGGIGVRVSVDAVAGQLALELQRMLAPG